MDFSFQPSPGIVLVELIPDEVTGVVLEDEEKGNVLRGLVLAIGPDLMTDFGQKLPTTDYCKVGDKIYFLSYSERNYDWIKVSGKTYYTVKVQDIRGILQ